MAAFENKWQKGKATIGERGTVMFNNDLLSDVRLVVQASTDESNAKKSKMAIPAHKFVLSICSPVFFAMFCGEMAERSDSIDLPDCEYEGVLEMLRYMYSEEVKLNESNVMQVLYVAKKYIVPSLADECIDFLSRNVDPTNVFCILTHAQQYEEKSLVDRCWEVIDRKTEEVVKSEGFATIERSLLEDIVKRDSLTIREVELFQAVHLWATEECERQGLAADGSVKRGILGEQIVKRIRFPAMEKEEFVSAVLDCKILTQEEVYNLRRYFSGVLITPLGFPGGKRVGSCSSCSRFGFFCTSNLERWSYNGSKEHDCIEVWVDKDIMLHGIRFFGSRHNTYTVGLTIEELEEDKILLNSVKRDLQSVPLPLKGEKIDVFDFTFDPFVLRKNTHYVVRATIFGPESCFGDDGVYLVECNGVTFHFDDWDFEYCDDETCVKTGQFAEFLFKPI